MKIREGRESKKDDAELRLLEAVCVQHEISHLNGETIFDSEKKIVPIKNNKSYRRNDKVKVRNNKTGEIKILKYKKAIPLLEKGWVLVES